MAYVIYRKGEEIKESWIRWAHHRVINKNQNNLITIVGATGSGKTYFGLSFAEKLANKNKVDFNITHVVFSLPDLMSLINSEKLKRGSVVLFDEPQISISNRDFQSKANKVFNYLLSTFRHLNYTLLFCTPYEDLLDKSTRKLFHAKLLMQSINIKNKTSTVRPYLIEYNSKLGKFYEKFLRVKYKPKGCNIYMMKPLKRWTLPIASSELLVQYEKKKRAFTKELNIEIESKLQSFNKDGKKGVKARRDLTDRQKEVLINVFEIGDKKQAADKLSITVRYIDKILVAVKRKGWTPESYYLETTKGSKNKNQEQESPVPLSNPTPNIT